MKIKRLNRERRRKIEHKHHHLFVCKHEKRYCTKLTTYTDGEAMLRLVDVPGNRHLVLLHSELTKVARGITKELLRWMLGLHSLNLTLDGQFTEELLYVSKPGQVKVKSSQIKYLKPLTPGGKASDRNRVAQIIETYLLSGNNGASTAIPHDVRHLLELLRNGQDDDDPVLSRHPGPMTEIEKLGLFIELFAQVESLELRDPEKHERVINSLPYGNGRWAELIEIHDQMSDVYYWRNRQGSYTKKPSSMLDLKRHSLGHLVKGHSVKVRIRKIKVNDIVTEERNVLVKFRYHQIAHMFSFTFPQTIPILQLSLHREKELEDIYYSDEE